MGIANDRQARVLRRVIAAALGVAGSTLMASAALAQSGPAWPTPAEFERAKTFVAPKVGAAYAGKLAQQPDLMGSWSPLVPPQNAGAGNPYFDPSDIYVPYRVPPGEQTFGPNAGGYMKNVPYKPEYQKKYMELVKEVEEGKSRDTFAACIPYGMPRFVGGSAGGNDIIQSPEVIIWHNVYSRDVRRIFLDGRAHPSADGPHDSDGRTLNGHSTGHWEGDTLVVETVNMLEGYYDETPAPFSKEVKVVERIRLLGPNLMEDQMTITDPVMLSRPWVVTRYFRRGQGANPPKDPNAIVHDFLNVNDRPCIPNVVMKDGFQEMILPQELEARGAPPSN